MATGLTLGTVKGYLEFAKLAGGGLVVDFSTLFKQVKSILSSTGQLTVELSASLDLAEATLKAHPELFEVGKATFVSSIDALLAKYPATTLLSDIPELGGGATPGSSGPATTTAPSAIVFSFFNGTTPTAEKLASLAEFAKSQFEAYKASGVARAEIGPYEALGRGFAETISFDTKYGKLSLPEFVKTAYRDVFERAATGAQETHFSAQVSYFQNLYVGAGMEVSAASALAKGAVVGQMLGFAVLDEAGKHPYLDGIVKALPTVGKSIGIAGTSDVSAQADFV